MAGQTGDWSRIVTLQWQPLEQREAARKVYAVAGEQASKIESAAGRIVDIEPIMIGTWMLGYDDLAHQAARTNVDTAWNIRPEQGDLWIDDRLQVAARAARQILVLLDISDKNANGRGNRPDGRLDGLHFSRLYPTI